jgi:hypothetical protein
MTSLDGRICHSCVTTRERCKALEERNDELTASKTRLKAKLKARNADLQTRDAVIKARDAEIQRLMESLSDISATLTVTQTHNQSLLRQVLGKNAVGTASRTSSVCSETVSHSASLGLSGLNLDSLTPTPSPTPTRITTKKKTSTPLTPPKASKSTKRAEPASTTTTTSKPSIRYHQCALCGWHQKASNKNMTRHYSASHRNYSHTLKDGKHFFYLVVDAPHQIWPQETPKPWEATELVGVEGVDASWLNIRPPIGKKTAPTASATKQASNRSKTAKTYKSSEFVDSSGDDDDDQRPAASTLGRLRDLSEPSSDDDANAEDATDAEGDDDANAEDATDAEGDAD